MQHTFSRLRTHCSFGHPDKYSLVTSAGLDQQAQHFLSTLYSDRSKTRMSWERSGS